MTEKEFDRLVLVMHSIESIAERAQATREMTAMLKEVNKIAAVLVRVGRRMGWTQ